MRSTALCLPTILCLAACGGADPATTETVPDAGTMRTEAPGDGGHAAPDAGVDPCANGVRDDGEVDVDCGGACAARCVAGAVCVDHGDCESDAYCRFSTGDGYRCVATAASCTAAACSPDEYCRLARMPDGRQRVECAPRVLPGQSCRGNFIGYDDLDPCTEGYACDEVCIVGPTEPGAPCRSKGKAACGPGLHCEQRAWREPLLCVPDKSAGERCLNQWECAAGLTCAGDRCTPRALEGEVCLVEEALSNLHCDLGQECRTPPGACRQDRDCRSGRCCAGGVGPVCKPPGEVCDRPIGICGALSD